PAPDFLRRRGLDAELDHAVVHPDLVPGLQVFQVLGMRDRRPLGGAHHWRSAERERPARFEVDAAAAAGAKRAEPDLRALEVLQSRYGPAPARLALADARDDLGVLLVGAVRKVEAGDVQPSRHQAIELGNAAARRTDRANDLGPAHRSGVNEQ